MDRRQFLESLGIGAAFALTATCLHSCKADEAGAVDFTIDLSASANAALQTNGGYIISNNCVVAKDTSGNYVAATVICSHEGEKKVSYDKNNNRYVCSAHGATFSLTGSPINSVTKNSLTIYKTSLSGTTLRVYS